MKAIMVMYDSLNRRMLPPYGNDWVHASNFQRLAERTVTFDNCFVGSAPCMPARRELHTGRYNFLHRSWGPLEPFDDSMPRLLQQNGVYTHMVTDHYHYWEEGGYNYHTMYNSWVFVRGQEGDPVYGEVNDPAIPEKVIGRKGFRRWRQDWVNRQYMQKEEDFPQNITFKEGIEFIHKNHQADNWFLQIETFDPHEPFFVPEKYMALYPHPYNGPHIDWPEYRKVQETPEAVRHVMYENAALVSMCDDNLGKVMQLMDRYDMWKDTMLIVNTDHGYMLGEHGWWGKNVPPFYNELAHIPLFIWDPRTGKQNERCECLVQTVDLPVTLLDFFQVAIPEDMQGKSLKDAILEKKPSREAALFGIHSGPVNCTDGRYVYMRAPVNAENKPLYNYTIMPAHQNRFFGTDELKTAEFAGPFSFTKGCKVLKTKAGAWGGLKPEIFETMLFDLKKDGGQNTSMIDPEVEKMMIRHMVRLMRENDCPVEQFERLGLSGKEG